MNDRLQEMKAEMDDCTRAIDAMIGKWTRSCGMNDPIDMHDWIEEINRLQQERNTAERRYLIERRQDIQRRTAAEIIDDLAGDDRHAALDSIEALNSMYLRLR